MSVWYYVIPVAVVATGALAYKVYKTDKAARKRFQANVVNTIRGGGVSEGLMDRVPAVTFVPDELRHEYARGPS